MLRHTPLAILLTSVAHIAQADAPKVVTDIAPVHSLVSMVTKGISEPSLIIDPRAGPHTNAIRPSIADALQSADVVFWIGEELSPWLEGPIETLASSAVRSVLLDVEGTATLAFREIDAFGGRSKKADDDHADDDHGDEDHVGKDPHAWLNPANAQLWLAYMAETLSTIDPDNSQAYKANAAAGQTAIQSEINAAANSLEAVASQPFVVFHDAYQYFENEFGLTATGALSLSDAVPPSPSHVAEIQSKIREDNVACVFSEPQFSDALVRTVIEGTDAKTVELDPLGADLEQGAGLYPGLIRAMTEDFVTCLQ